MMTSYNTIVKHRFLGEKDTASQSFVPFLIKIFESISVMCPGAQSLSLFGFTFRIPSIIVNDLAFVDFRLDAQG
jgi:hypothetical protein